MYSTRILLLLVTALLSHNAVAQGLPDAVGELQSQLSALTQRVADLESNAPTSNVEGRTYCFVLDVTIMRGFGNDATEQLSTNIVRRTATFSGGMLTGASDSNFRNLQDDDGVVSFTDEFSADPLTATYTQSSNKLDVVFANGTTANWYVSGDGSLISGTTIMGLGPFPNGISVGLVRDWTLVENATCDAEGI